MEEISEIDRIFNEVGIKSNKKLKKYSIEYKLKILRLIDLNVSLHQIEAKSGMRGKKIKRLERERKFIKRYK